MLNGKNVTGLEDLLKSLVKRLEKLGIEYALLGGLAVSMWTVPRPTFDIDIAVSVSPDRLQEIFNEFEDIGLSIAEDYRKGYLNSLKGMPKFKAIWFSELGDIPIDVFVVEREYQKEAFGRRRRVALAGYSVWAFVPEDLILHKLLAGRRKDFADVEALLAIQGPGDTAYLRRWADSLGIRDQLEDFLREISA